MPKAYTRIPLDAKPEFAVEIDRASAKLTLKTGERQKRTGFIVRAIRAEVDGSNMDQPPRRKTMSVIGKCKIFLLVGLSTFAATPPAAVADGAECTSVATLAACTLGGQTSYVYCEKTPRANFIMKSSSGLYYSYASGSDDGFPVFTSPDLITWQEDKTAKARPQKSATSDELPDWVDADPQFWPPEVIEHNGKFYMFYSAVASAASRPRFASCHNNHFIGLAIADLPTGPFVDIGRPLMGGTPFDDGTTSWGQTRTIDPNPFVDVDGTVYLYFDKPGACYEYSGQRESRIYVAKLSADLKQIASQPKLLLKPSQDWERRTGGDNIKNEAPEMLRRDGRYYLMYSANGFCDDSYAVGYAVSDSPTGSFTKYDRNPIISEIDGIEKSGHNHIVYSPDGRDVYTTYNTFEGKFLSRIDVRGDGTLYANGPYATIGTGSELRVVPKPSGAPIYSSSDVPIGTVYDHAQDSDARASSSVRGSHHFPQQLKDGEIGVRPRFADYDWRANGERAGAWVNLSWPTARPVDTILIYPSADPNYAVSKGTLQLNGGVSIPVVFPSQSKAPAVIGPSQLGGRVLTTNLKFTVTGFVSGATGDAALSEISVLGPPPTP